VPPAGTGTRDETDKAPLRSAVSPTPAEFLECYRLLGLAPGAGWTDVRAAYRREIRKWHPDRQARRTPHDRTAAEDRTKAINHAYRTLSTYYRRHGRLPLPERLEEDARPSAREFDAGRRYAAERAPEPDASTPAPEPSFSLAREIWQRLRAAIPAFALFAAAIVGARLFLESPPEPDASTVAAPPRHADNGATATPEKYFTLGSTPGDVYAAQGVPTKTEDDVWHYGSSRVYFRDGRVVGWDAEPGTLLNARLYPSGGLPRLESVFTYGSTKSEVRRIQGEPTAMTDKAWDYGLSRVYFENDRVVGWAESPMYPLRVQR